MTAAALAEPPEGQAWRAERAATYSPILPVSPKSGIVLQVPVTVVDADKGLVSFEDEGETITHSILGGGAKHPGHDAQSGRQGQDEKDEREIFTGHDAVVDLEIRGQIGVPDHVAQQDHEGYGGQ